MMEQEAAYEAVVKEVESLIGRRQLRQALRVARTAVDRYPFRFRIWHQLYLILRMRGYYVAAQWAAARAKECVDYDMVAEGDLERDILFAQIGQRKIPEDAYARILRLRKLHSGDRARLACIAGLEARLAYARGRYITALALHTEADAGLSNEGLWQTSNKFHMLKAAVCTDGPSSETQKLFNELSIYQKNGLLSRGRLVRAWAMQRFGRPACWLDDKLAKR